MSRLFRALRSLHHKTVEKSMSVNNPARPPCSGEPPSAESEGGKESSILDENRNGWCFLGHVGTEPLRCSIEEMPGADAGVAAEEATDYAMMYVIAGRGRVRRAGTRWRKIDRGTVVQFVPGYVYDVEFDADAKVKLAEVHLPMAAWEMLAAADPVLEFVTSFALGLQVSIVRRFEALVDKMNSVENDVLPLQVLSEAVQLVVSLHARAVASGSIQGAELAISKACRRLSANPCDRVRIPDLAKELGVGHTQFRMAFKEMVGIPPGDYQIRRRIDLARQVMRETPGISVSELVEQLGYPDIHSFSKQFKQVAGMTPSAYAKALG